MKTNFHTFQLILLIGIGFLLFILTYEKTLVWLYQRYTLTESYYSHGFLVPFICAYFVYKKREKLLGSLISFSYFGLFLIVIALTIHFLSVIIHVYFISGFSILILIFGACLFLQGVPITKILFFPLLYLIFMFPLPLIAIQKISIPLKSIVTYSSVEFVNLIGMQAVQSGFLINLSDGVLTVGNPCSGLRSIFSFTALGSIFLIENKMSPKKTLLFLFSCIPIAIFSNISRVVFLTITAHVLGTESVSDGNFYHDFSGYAVFIIGLIMMYLLWKGIE